MTISELHSICMEFFTTTDNSYYPFFFVILDGRTAVDGTVIIAHDRPAGYDRRAGDPPEELRVTPGSLPNLLACLDIQHTVISSILVNRMDEEDEESFVDDVVSKHTLWTKCLSLTWVHVSLPKSQVWTIPAFRSASCAAVKVRARNSQSCASTLLRKKHQTCHPNTA